MDEESLNTAINLVRSGQRLSARSLLVRLLREDPSNETAWMWLVETMDNDTQRAEVLRKCLAAIPGSEAALNALKRLRVPVPTPSQPQEDSSSAPPPFMATVQELSAPPPSDNLQEQEGAKTKSPGSLKRLLKGCLVILSILVISGLLGGTGYYFYRYYLAPPAPAPTVLPAREIVPTETRATRFVLQPTATSTPVPSPTSQPTPTYKPAPNFDPKWKIAWTVKDAGLYSLSSVGVPILQIPGYPYSVYPPPVDAVTVSEGKAWLHPAKGGSPRVLVSEPFWAAATEGWDAEMGDAMPLPSRSAVVLEAVQPAGGQDPRVLGFIIVSNIGGEVLFVLPIDPVPGKTVFAPDGDHAAIVTPSSIILIDFESGVINTNLITYKGASGQFGAAPGQVMIHWLEDGKTFYAIIPKKHSGSGHHLYKVDVPTANVNPLNDIPENWDMEHVYFQRDGSLLVFKDDQGNQHLFNPQDAELTPLSGIGDVVSGADDGRHFLLWTGKEYWVSQVDGEPYRLGLPGMQLEKPAWLGNLDLVFLVKEDTRYSLYYQGMTNPPQRLVAGLGTKLDEIGLFTWPEDEYFQWEPSSALSTPQPAPSLPTKTVDSTRLPGFTATPGPAVELQPIPGLPLQTVLNSLWKKGFNCLLAEDTSASPDALEYRCSRYDSDDVFIQSEISYTQGEITSITGLITPPATGDQNLEIAVPAAMDHFPFLASLPYQDADPEKAGAWLLNAIQAVVQDGKPRERSFGPVLFRLSTAEALVLEMSAIVVTK